MKHIAIALGVSYSCVRRDVQAVRRFQTGVIGGVVDDIVKREPSKEPRNVKARARRRYFCLNCGESWRDSGAWKPAKIHAEKEGHDVAQGTAEKYVIKYACQPKPAEVMPV